MPTSANRNLTETDLALPVCRYLRDHGYTVRSEVRDCDITATKGDDLIIVELKRNFSTALLAQATKRQRITDSVYVALPRPSRRKARSDIQHLLRRLELGLIFVSVNGRPPRVEVVFHPIPFQRQKRKRARRAVLREMSQRSEDFNTAGSSQRKLVTAYRENAIQIACYLDVLGPMSPRQLRALGTGPKTLSILYSNFYGWFERIDRGLYALRPQAREELRQYPGLAEKCREEAPARARQAQLRSASAARRRRSEASGKTESGRGVKQRAHGLLSEMPCE